MIEQIQNYRRLHNRIATAGQPTELQLCTIKAAGFERIINLLPLDSPYALKNEAALVRSLGLEYVHIPVSFAEPTVKDFKLFCQMMKQHREQRLFIHCAMNRRVSVFIFLYQTIKEQIPSHAARTTMEITWKPNTVWQNFIVEVQQHFAEGRHD